MPVTSPLTRTPLVGPALAMARAAGLDVATVGRSYGLLRSAESDPEIVMPVDVLEDLLATLAERSQDPLFGLHLARLLPRGTWGLLEYVCRAAPTFGEFLRALTRFSALSSDVATMKMRARDGGVEFEHAVVGEPTALGRHANECVLAMMLRLGAELTALPRHLLAERAWLAHPRHAASARVVRELGLAHVTFGVETTGVFFRADALERPMVSADPRLHSILTDLAERELVARRPGGLFLQRVRQTMRDELRERLPTLAITARRIGMSERTLQRKLEDEGTTFVAQLESVRETLACTLLRDGARSIATIASELHYADASTFARAFRRWRSMTPNAFRGD
jgi:AraC-like DNA-binding protein